jgi:YndJ-like protein
MSGPSVMDHSSTHGGVRSARLTAEAVGALLWLVIVIAALAGRSRLGPIEILFLLAPLVHVQLGFRVVQRQVGEDSPVRRVAHSLLPCAAILAAASFWPPPGRPAAVLATGWLVVGGLAALDGLWRLLRGGYRSADSVCNSVSFLFLAVGSVWLILSRLGITPFHLKPQTVFLAVVHFHFTGFVLLVVAGATGRALRTLRPFADSAVARNTFRFVVAGIICGPILLAAGNILVIPLLKLVGALLLTVASIGLAGMLAALLPEIEPQPARALLTVSGLSLVAGMMLVGAYTVGEFTESYWLLIPQMARFHGTANALGFGLCGLLGWTLASVEALELPIDAS